MKYPILFLLFCSAVFAGAPTYKADLREYDEQGNEIVRVWGGVEGTLHLSGDPIGSFTLSEIYPDLRTDVSFEIIGVEEDDCGVSTYFGDDFELRDSSHSTCKRFEPAPWQVEIYGKPVRYFRGTPELVFDVEACVKRAEATICYERYLPATCYADTSNQKRNSIKPISAEGTNTCFAAINLRKLACKFEISPEELTKEDIRCRVHSK